MIRCAVQGQTIVEIIRIGEYIAWRQPGIAKRLEGMELLPQVATNDDPSKYYDVILAEDNPIFKKWKRMMEKPPKPGRSGGR